MSSMPGIFTSAPKTLVELLRGFVEQQPERLAYKFLHEGQWDGDFYTYGDLDRRARAIAARLQEMNAAGERALLLYPPGIDFVAAFFGCLYAGVTAVPAYPPKMNRKMLRLESIAGDATPKFALTTAQIYARVEPKLEESQTLQVEWLTTDEIEESFADQWREPIISADTLAFLQYTSGSTGSPKGVMVSHGNLIHNEQMIQQAFDQSAESLIFGWLPLYHDMGLIGQVLQPLFLGTSCIMLSPIDFLTNPYRWLEGISKYRATTSGGPNFAYDLAARKITAEQRETLDLSSWTVAFNGAEPVRKDTLERFALTFAETGFRKEAFYPCYGLAEATLFVTGGHKTAEPVYQEIDGNKLKENEACPVDPETAHALSMVGSGQAWSGQKVLVVDPETLTECPAGRVGEIWVAGPSVAKGYWGNEEATAYTFEAHLADTLEGPFLRTGDLGYFQGEELYVTGRLKDLIIIRGRNHYPQDLEHTASHAHHTLQPEAVAAFAVEAGGEERLVIVSEVQRTHWRSVDAEEVAAAVRKAVAQTHELQVHAVVVIKPGSIPKTSSGKIQRRACKELFLTGGLNVIGDSVMPDVPVVTEQEPFAELNRELLLAAPEEQREALVRDFLQVQVAGVLRVPSVHVGLDQSFSTLGLDSLMAVELKHRIETELGLLIPAIDLLEDADVEQLAAQLVASLDGGESGEVLPLTKAEEAVTDAGLSHGQQMMWFQQQLEPDSAAYHVPFATRICSEVDVAALERAFQVLTERHPVLRTVYTERNGLPVQNISKQSHVSIDLNDVSKWEPHAVSERLVELVQTPFDLSAGPVFRVHLLSVGAAEHVLLLNFHHVAVDLWSITVLIEELRALYTAETGGAAAELAPLPVEYTDYVRWQEQVLGSAYGEQLAAYWQEQLADANFVLDLPVDRTRPPVQTHRGASHAFRFSPELTRGLKELAKRESATLYTTLLAAFQTLLYRYTGQENLVVGSPAAGRPSAALQGLVGYFVNPLVLRGRLSAEMTFTEFLRQMRSTVLKGLAHQEYPFSRLVDSLQTERDPSRHPLFQTMFILQKPHRMDELAEFVLGEAGARIDFGGLVLESMALEQRVSQFDLTLAMVEANGALSASYEYNADLFDRATMERLAANFEVLLTAIVAEADTPLGQLALLGDEDKRKLAAWNETGSRFGQAGTLPGLFEAQVQRTPDATALVVGEHTLTYRELNARANRVAHRLQCLGIGADSFVGVCLHRSAELVVALLGVLKAGGAYVPLDPAYPQERIEYMLADAKAGVLLTEEGLRDRLTTEGSVLCLDPELTEFAAQSEEDPAGDVREEHLAYAIYTSGSTGKPKGVAIEHRNATTFLRWAHDAFTAEEMAGVLFATSVCFDLSIFELFGTLSRGGKVILAENALYLPTLPAREDVTLVNTVPSAINELLRLEGLPASVRTVNLAGEPLKRVTVDRLYATGTVGKVYNLYGPSEDTTYSTYTLVPSGVPEEPTIGRPITGTKAYVLDSAMRPVPVGVAGELYLGGDGLAREYLNLPEMTAEKFVSDPFSEDANARLYRTGDLVRYLADGELEYLGRIDHQVKIRGFRIELGELESVLSRHPAVREVVVVVREDVPGDRRLAAYLSLHATEGGAPSKKEWVRFLKQYLPEYMIPSAFVVLDGLPLTPNGKVDRKKLPKPDLALSEQSEYAAPATLLEEQVAAVWSEVLGAERVGTQDNFFALGGHSLLAVQIVSRLRDTLGMQVALRDLFDAQTVAELADLLTSRSEDGKADAAAIETVDRESCRQGDLFEIRASSAQRRFWLLDRLTPGNPAYNMPAAVRLRGLLDRDALERSLQEIVHRHEVLRTNFAERDGVLMQVIDPQATLTLAGEDLRDVPASEREAQALELAKAEAERGFDLARGPLLRARLVELGAEEHLLLVTMHHIVSDGWSIGVMIRELAVHYEAFVKGATGALPELSVQVADAARWQEAQEAGDACAGQLAYWKDRLSDGVPVLQFPTDRPRPAMQTHSGALHRFVWPKALADEVNRMSRQQGVTPFMTLLTAFKALLARYTGQEDIAVGSPVAGRNRREFEPLIGLFVNTLVLRTDLSGQPTFLDLLGRVRETALGAYAHQDVPFDKVVEEVQPQRDLSYTPLFQVMFSMQNVPMPALALDGLHLEPLEADSGAAKFDLTMFLEEAEEGLIGRFEYNTDLFDATTMERLEQHLRTLLAAAIADPEQAVAELPLLTEGEQERLAAWNRTDADYPQDALLHRLVAAQAQATPDRIAVTAGEERLSYRELNDRANALAHRLIACGVGPDVLVGICMDRSKEMTVGLLAILKAGGAYVPLDPSYPADRLAYMAEDAKFPVLLTQSHLQDRLPKGVATAICLDSEWKTLTGEPMVEPAVDVSADHLAYVIYTSGSTGRPKGVMIPHRAICNHMLWMRDAYPLAETDRVLQKTPFGFDASVWEFWAPLLAGAELVMARPGGHQDSGYLAQAVVEHEITTLQVVPTMLGLLLTEPRFAESRSLRRVFCGGEALTVDLQTGLYEKLPYVSLHNLYGPTEAAIDTTVWDCVKGDAGRCVPIGRPIANVQVHLLDEALRPVPVGVPGELYVGGRGLARGYWNRPELTEASFIAHELAGEQPDARLYKTGDIGRRLPGGEIEYIGRRDHQVKLRGLRIELGEIESRLAALPGVATAVVIVREDVPGDQRIVAYWTAALEEQPGADDLRRSLKEHLPEYMVPSAFVLLAEMPLTPNGKLDRKGLPAPADDALYTKEYVAPASGLQAQVAAIWSELLHRDRIGAHDNFFEIGGHSLLATQVVSRLRQTMGLELELREIFEHPTVAGLAARLELAQAGGTSAAVASIQAITGTQDMTRHQMSFAQRRMWMLDQVSPGNPAYNMPGALRLQGVLDVEALERSLQEIVRRHHVLRSVFIQEGDTPQQVVLPQAAVQLQRVDLTHLPQHVREERAMQAAQEEAERPFHLGKGPLFRAALVQLGTEEHLLLLTFHHIVSDGWSIGLFVREWVQLYEAFVSGQPSPLADLPLQYSDYALWQQERLEGELLAEQLPYWKEILKGDLPLLQLPTDRPRPAVLQNRGKTYRFAVPAGLAQELQALSQQEGSTLFMTLLTAFKILLHRYTGQRDLLVGTPVANRHHAQIEDLIGFFVNTLVVRTDVSGEMSFRELLGRVKESTLGAFDHQDVPFEKLVEELQPKREMSYSPLFQVMFAMQNTPAHELKLPGLTVQQTHLDNRTAKFDLTLFVEERADGLSAALEYSTDLFEEATIRRLADHFVRLLGSIAQDAAASVGELDLLSAEERHRLLVEWQGTRSGDPQATLVELLEAQVQRTPERVALIDGESRWTYAELNGRSNQMARYLQKRGIGAGTRTGLCMARRAEMLVAILGILKAGGAYVPLDPNYPADRTLNTLEDAQVTLLLTQEEVAATLSGYQGASVEIRQAMAELGEESDADLIGGATPQDLAYVIYTSGSTGRSKGVAIEHHSASTLVRWAQDVYTPEEYAGVLFATSICFDLSIFEMFVPLCSGGKVILAENALHVPLLPAKEEITLINTVPSSIQEMLRLGAIPASAKVINLAGEPLKKALVHSLYQLPTVEKVYNLYGPSEDTTYSTYALVERQLAGNPLIGRPVADTEAYVLNPQMQPVPVGVAGELYLGGGGLAREYFNQPELTREKFIPHPFAKEAGERLYRTGDLVRCLPDGSLDYLGRIDHQVKVRGFRIELGEIESVLNAQAGVQESAVIVREEESGNPRIVAYVVAAPDLLKAADLRRAVKQKLPGYMVPAAFVILDALPLTPNGKLDRNALPLPTLSREEQEGAYVAPRTPTEAQIAALFGELLGMEQVSVEDNFFDLGGHSLLVTRLAARLRDAFEKDVPLQALFKTPTVAEIAVLLEQTATAPASGSAEKAAEPEIKALSRGAHRRKRGAGRE